MNNGNLGTRLNLNELKLTKHIHMHFCYTKCKTIILIQIGK